jgi:hypothetical protein
MAEDNLDLLIGSVSINYFICLDMRIQTQGRGRDAT